MSLIRRFKDVVSVFCHGLPKPVYANITYIKPNALLKNKKIIVTGGGSGLGFAMAKRFVEEGAKVLITGRDEVKLKKAATYLNCNYLVFDVQDVTMCDEFINKAERILGEINVLVNNAGISLHEQSFFDVSPDTFRKQLGTNLEGPFFLTQSFVRLLMSNKQKGTVLFVSSETGDTVDFRPYGFTKGAINSMVKGLAYLFKKDGIRINAIAPGVTASAMTGLSADGNLSAGDYGTGRYYLPEEVAQIASILVSDVSGIVSGQIITCNNAQTVNARWK